MIIIDSNFLCYRELYKIPYLSYEEKPTNVVYGFLRGILKFVKDIGEGPFVFVWDSKTSFRREAFFGYKKREPSKDPKIQEALKIGLPQFTEIREEVLPDLGFSNIFFQEGIEADDIIASIVKNKKLWNFYPHFTIVSSDNDLFQLLSKRVSMFNYKEKFTSEWFEKTYLIRPFKWAEAKAIAGCSTDTVDGVKGVGIKTAIKFILGTCSQKIYDKIKSNDPLIERNYGLVFLPYERTEEVILKTDTLSLEKYESICDKYSFHSLLKREPMNIWRKLCQKQS